MDSAQAKKIPIEAFLDKLNHKPAQAKGTDLWYKSPLRKVHRTGRLNHFKIKSKSKK